MERTSDTAKVGKLWEAAILSAAGPLSAIITPETYGLSVLRVRSGSSAAKEPFETEIAARIALGCAVHCLQLLLVFEREITSSYRHEINVSSSVIDGKIVVARLVALRANGDWTRIPTVKARRQLVTPENLLASEMILTSIKIMNYWRGRGGAEAVLAARMLLEYQKMQSRRPWADLSLQPRATLSVLAGLVQSRTKSGWNLPKATINQIAELALGKSPHAALVQAAGPLGFLASQDERFADKLFELLCLGWFYLLAKASLEDVRVDTGAMRTGTRPLISARLDNIDFDIYYQRRFGPSTLWTWEESGKKLEAIPDVILSISTLTSSRIVLIDAKNRSAASESEVAYKLLGYKDNLNFKPYFAIAVFPEFEHSKVSYRGLRKEEDQVLLVRIPLLITEARLRAFARRLWRLIGFG